MKRNKKKGFTLVELIAVIAILAILAAVVVPKVTSYTTSAKLSAKKADASTILSSVEIYNAQATIQVASGTKLSDIKDTATTLDTTGPAEQAAKDLKEVVTRALAKSGSIDGDTTVSELSTLVNATN
jgi:type IV pilus assembly protein PilA